MAKKKTTGGQSEQILKKQIKEGTVGNLYVVFGEEDYLRTYYLDQLREKLVGGFGEDFNYHTFEGKTLELEQLATAVEAMPMLSERTLVVVRDFDLFRARQEVRDKLAELLTDLPAYCCLVFLYEHTDYAPDRRQKKLAEAMDRAQVIEFAKQSDRELAAWIRRRFLALEKDIDGELCQYLCYLTGGTMSALIPEIEKVAAYAPGERITKGDIDAVVTPILDASTFEMTKAVSAGDFGGAMAKLEELFQLQNDPIPILWSVGKQMRQLYSARVFLEAGKRTAELRQLCGVSDYAARQIMDAAGRFSTAWCADAVRLCARADVRLKTSYGDGKSQLELLLLKLAQEAKQ